MSRIMIAGTGSGCGKTTMTCAVLAALSSAGKSVIAFKCGPDYIDPMFHRKVTGTESRNLDIFLMGEEQARYSLCRNSERKDIAVIEGVMGFYDGIGSTGESSAHHLSQVTKTPVILVVSARGKANSICAEIKGYVGYEQNNICAVLLNHVSEASYGFYKSMIEEKTGIKAAGFLPSIPEAEIASRHLGLVTADEIQDIRQKIELLADAARRHVDLEWICEKASQAEPLTSYPDIWPKQRLVDQGAKIYVARDEAFCFFYEDNHEILKAYGAELCFFSPLRDEALPEDADGLILWGGYPELYAEALEKNENMKCSLQKRIEGGLPVYGECGGFIYLQEQITCKDGKTYEFVGALKGKVKMTDRLQNFGYVELTALSDNLMCRKGDMINAHSFHYAKSDDEGDVCIARKKSRNITYPCVAARDNIWAGYPHLHFWNNPGFAENFIAKCRAYRCRHEKEGEKGKND